MDAPLSYFYAVNEVFCRKCIERSGQKNRLREGNKKKMLNPVDFCSVRSGNFSSSAFSLAVF